MAFDPKDLTEDELTLMFSASIVMIRGASNSSETEKKQAIVIADMAVKVLAKTGGMPAFINKAEAFADGYSGQTVDRRADQDSTDASLNGENVSKGSRADSRGTRTGPSPDGG